MTDETRSEAMSTTFTNGCVTFVLSNGMTVSLTKAQTDDLMQTLVQAYKEGKPVVVSLPEEWLKKVN